MLIESLYEMPSAEAKERMRHHGHVRGLRKTAEQLGAIVTTYRLLDEVANPLNPNGVLILRKSETKDTTAINVNQRKAVWQCPLSGARLTRHTNGFCPRDRNCLPDTERYTVIAA